MNKDKRELINHLYAIATGLLNEAEELAIKGQSHSITEEDISTVSGDVLAKMEDTTAIVKTAQVVAGS